MSTQPKAIRLADEISKPWYRWQAQAEAAAELRRLHEENERLHLINQSHEMKLSVRGYEIQIEHLKVANQELTENLEKKSVAIQRIWKERDELRKLNEELLAIAHQYASDLRYPPIGDSRVRRLDAVLAVIKKAEGS